MTRDLRPVETIFSGLGGTMTRRCQAGLDRKDVWQNATLLGLLTPPGSVLLDWLEKRVYTPGPALAVRILRRESQSRTLTFRDNGFMHRRPSEIAGYSLGLRPGAQLCPRIIEAILDKIGTPVDMRGHPWTSLDILGDILAYPWISLDILGYPWTSLGIHENWISCISAL